MTGKALAAWQHIVETAGIQGGSNARHGFNVGPRRSVGASPVAVAQAASTAEPLSGPQPLEDRKVLTGMIFVLRTGIPWREMPPELGGGSGMTCLRRLKPWHRTGVFQKLYEILLADLNGADTIDWSRALVDSATTKAPSGGEKTGPNPTDRRKLGSKVHVLVDATGIPLAITVTGAQAHDVTHLIPLVEEVPPVRGKKAGQDEDPTWCKGIAVLTRSRIAISSGNGASSRSSRRGGPNMAPASGRRGGMSREPWPGSRATGRSGYEPNGERRTTRRWSTWRPASSGIGTDEVILLRALSSDPTDPELLISTAKSSVLSKPIGWSFTPL